MGRYEALKAMVVPGLEEAVEGVIREHVGAAQAIGRRALVSVVSKRLGERVHERKVREAVRALRRKGRPICALPGEGGGYFWARDEMELEEFLQREYLAKARDMEETVRAMRIGAQQYFGKRETPPGRRRPDGWVPVVGENVWVRWPGERWVACRVLEVNLRVAGTMVKVAVLGGGGERWVPLNDLRVWEY